MTALDYIEREATKNMDFHLKNVECITAEANTTLNYLFVLGLVSFGSSVKLYISEKAIGWIIALALLTLYFVYVAAVLTASCLRKEDLMPPANEPRNLIAVTSKFSIDEIRKAELENLQERIDFNQKRTQRAGSSLNRIRYLLFASPVMFAVAVALLQILSSVAGLHWF